MSKQSGQSCVWEHRSVPARAVLLTLCFSGHCLLGQGTQPSPQRFKQYVGKYPAEVFKQDQDLDRRVRSLLGNNCAYFMERMQTTIPVDMVRNFIVLQGCKAHECGDEEAFLLIDLNSGHIHCAIVSDKYGGNDLKTFSEDPWSFPDAALKLVMQY